MCLKYTKRLPIGTRTSVQFLGSNRLDGSFCVTTELNENAVAAYNFRFLNDGPSRLVPLTNFCQGSACLVERKREMGTNHDYLRAIIVDPGDADSTGMLNLGQEEDGVYSTPEFQFFMRKLAPIYPIKATSSTYTVYLVDFGMIAQVKPAQCFELFIEGCEIVSASPIFPIRCRLNRVWEYARPFAVSIRFLYLSRCLTTFFHPGSKIFRRLY